jgi:hypothetical protein
MGRDLVELRRTIDSALTLTSVLSGIRDVQMAGCIQEAEGEVD